MKVCYNTNILNENKDPLIPNNYPWIEYHVEDDFVCPEGFLEMSEIDFETMKSAIDISAFNTALAKATIHNVTPRQIRLALLQFGINSSMIDAALNSLPEPQKSIALIEWNHSSFFERNWPLVDQVAALLGWTESQIDSLWILAANL